MADEWASQSTGISGPARHAAAVTPNDGADLPYAARSLYVGGAGDLSIVTVGGETVTLAGVQAGTIVPLCVARVRSASTTATSILALW